MKFLKWLGVGVGVLVMGVVLLVFAARSGDGPTAILPGGPLEAGELHTGPEPDWTFARDIEELEIQLLEPPWLRENRVSSGSFMMNSLRTSVA